MEIKKENVVKAYMASDDNARKMLREMFPDIDFETERIPKRPITERIKTFEDACKELGTNHPLVLQYEFNYNAEGGWKDSAETRDFSAYLKLRIITAALNEGWKPQFTGYGFKYYSWYAFYTKDEWRSLSEDTKRERGVLFCGRAACGAFAGFVCEYSYVAPSDSDASVGSRLYYKNRELALYSGKQFASLWLDFCYLPNTECKPYIDE